MGTFVTEEPELTGKNVTAAMTDREKLLQILDKPIFPRTDIDPLEAVTDYLLDCDVVPVVRCKDCKLCRELDRESPIERCYRDGVLWCDHDAKGVFPEDFCSHGERRGE